MTTTVLAADVMSNELIKTLIATASERSLGLTLRVTSICGQATDREMTFKAIKPGTVVQKDDGRIGFQVDDASYISANKDSGARFLVWLHAANMKAVSGKDYGQPRNCFFHRCR